MIISIRHGHETSWSSSTVAVDRHGQDTAAQADQRITSNCLYMCFATRQESCGSAAAAATDKVLQRETRGHEAYPRGSQYQGVRLARLRWVYSQPAIAATTATATTQAMTMPAMGPPDRRLRLVVLASDFVTVDTPEVLSSVTPVTPVTPSFANSPCSTSRGVASCLSCEVHSLVPGQCPVR